MEKILDHERLLENHEERIVTLEKSDTEKELRIQTIEKNYMKLENTILQENRDTRSFFQSTMDKQWELIKSRDSAVESEKIRTYDLRKTKMERNADLLLKYGGAGSVLYLFLQSLFNILSK